MNPVAGASSVPATLVPSVRRPAAVGGSAEEGHGLLEQRAQVGEERGGVGAIKDPVVAGQGKIHDAAHDDAAVVDDGPFDRGADREDGGLPGVDDARARPTRDGDPAGTVATTGRAGVSSSAKR